MQEQRLRTEFRMSENVHLAIPPFDIFLSEPDGGVLWRGSAVSVEEAKTRIQELAANAPGQYIILSRQTGRSILCRVGALRCRLAGSWICSVGAPAWLAAERAAVTLARMYVICLRIT